MVASSWSRGGAAPAIAAWWAGGGGRELARYATVGVVCTIVYSALFVVLLGSGPLLANVAASVVATVLGTELHRRLTFRTGPRVGWAAAQWQSAGVAALGLVVTTAVLAAVELLVPGSTWWEEVLVVNATTGLIGVGRYVVLRRWVFRGPDPGARQGG
ncbi:GtrA family protein [Rhodococcus antarcticus]|uniref:GtrA family protein n=1 Tax=Rhodococcus antarcticus TaxID=2987751 RepID=A0ABY6P1Z4_9NOCA|nr:GtrA family protein [Rhodococcus antarcticus]UZJ25163.1 GtrA family protein [Rhodococcus antarcticus]